MNIDLSQPLFLLPDPLPIPPIERPFDVTIRPPGSKSITNRALLLAALADGTSTLHGALTEADDAQVMIRALTQLGAKIEQGGGATGGLPTSALRITGVNGRWKIPRGQTVSLDLHNAGTATRFLAAAALLAPPDTTVVIDGDARMRERPIGELVEALNTLTQAIGGNVACANKPGFPPLSIRGADSTSPPATPTVRFGRTQSSQFISALLLVAPFLPRGLAVGFDDAITSEPYIDMTLGLLRRVGVNLTDNRPRSIGVEPTAPALPAFHLDIEPDSSGATYFLAAAALFRGARVTIDGLDLGPKGSLQGDTQFVRILTAMGATVERLNTALRITGPARLTPIDADLSDMPDTAMTAAVLCCFAETTAANPTATSTLRGLRTLRVKETDRLEALRTELSRLGATVKIFARGEDECLSITPTDHATVPKLLNFDTYHDHRMAMALALVGLRIPGVHIRDPRVRGEDVPGLWNDLHSLTANL